MTEYARDHSTQLAYTDQGKGTIIVFLHGFCEDKNIWFEFSKYFLEQAFRVIAIDLPGFGNSSVIEGVRIQDMATSVNNLLQNIAPEHPCILIGHSMGGYVSLAYAELFPKHLLGLGIFHSHPFADSESKKNNREKSVDIIQKIGVARFTQFLLPSLFNESFIKSNPKVIEKVQKIGNQQPLRGVIAAQLAMKNRPDRSHVLKTLEIPALFIIGHQDSTLTFQQSLAQTHLPARSLVKSFPSLGHMGMFEATLECQEAIKEFVNYCLS